MGSLGTSGWCLGGSDRSLNDPAVGLEVSSGQFICSPQSGLYLLTRGDERPSVKSIVCKRDIRIRLNRALSRQVIGDIPEATIPLFQG